MEVQWRPGGGVNECDLGTAQKTVGSEIRRWRIFRLWRNIGRNVK